MYQAGGKNKDLSSTLEDCSAYADFSSIVTCMDDWPSKLWSLASETVEVIRHANGFLKIRLVNYPDGSCLRLHKWDHGFRGNPHNHKWDFIGFVLQGKLIERKYFDSENFGGREKRIFHYKEDLLVDTGVVSKYEAYTKELVALDTPYYRAAEELHEVVSVEKNTLSIVATAPAQNNVSVLVLADISQNPKYERAKISTISSETCRSLI